MSKMYKLNDTYTCSWGLRTPDNKQYYRTFITDSGNIDTWGRECNQEVGVRPALWIKVY